jgi:hypothetical protein
VSSGVVRSGLVGYAAAYRTRTYNRTSSLGSLLFFSGNLTCFRGGLETDVEGTLL